MQDVKRESPIPLNNYANAKGVKQFQSLFNHTIEDTNI